MDELRKICYGCSLVKSCVFPPCILKNNEPVYCPCLHCIVLPMCESTCEDYRSYMDHFTFGYPDFDLVYNDGAKPMNGEYYVS